MGAFAAYGPDLVVGYTLGFWALAEMGLGKWSKAKLESNRDHWRADHCIDAEAVPGVLFCNEGLGAFSCPSYRDFPALRVGAKPDEEGAKPSLLPPISREDEEVVKERLRVLGYL